MIRILHGRLAALWLRCCASPAPAPAPALALALTMLLVLAPAAPMAARADSPAPIDYSKQAARASPEWLHEGVIYQIFPRQFSTQGDLKGITAQLDRLQKLGVNILWLMPIHPVGKLKAKGTLGSPYAVRDYYAVNPEYGSAADLHQLVSEAHQRGLKVIIDIVANHTSWDSVLMKHPEYYWHDAKGNIIPPEPDWADVAHLQYANVQLRRYMIDMLKFWIKDFDLDGFRCDAAGLVPTDFWEQARAELSVLKPDIAMLAEWDDPALLAKAFDIDYAWKGYHALGEVLQGHAPASAVREEWQRSASQYERGALRMRFTDNHDQLRALARFGEPAALAGAALMFTLDGVPLIYNGMEVGDTAESGAPALFEKLPIYWDSAQLRPQFPEFFRAIVALHKEHSAFTHGDLSWVHNSDEARVLTYLRRSATETLLVAVNLSSQPFVGVVEAGDGFVDITPERESTNAAQKLSSAVPALSLGAWEYRVLRQQQMRPVQ